MTLQDARGNLHAGNGRFATKPSAEGTAQLRLPDLCGPHEAANRLCRAFPDLLDPEAPHHTRHSGLAEVLAATRHWADARGLDFDAALQAPADKEPVLPPARTTEYDWDIAGNAEGAVDLIQRTLPELAPDTAGPAELGTTVAALRRWAYETGTGFNTSLESSARAHADDLDHDRFHGLASPTQSTANAA